ncbi:hypothetical protein [Mucilaginibacter myungsuensis]|uniref:T9SS C-terminal target domain-containing protein n=1 Tax=Mucilaginibacter myungsuensis TaxID=649104 RepID=A0A929L139_9SPHI|nr:hypothetical protein [Mucilaginibacter myungsuensis]MBE9664198.1 hypothetical protein [Mucilaginibacter myungsuensis]MDN3599900.1 hypothetical protein [Mucilaginibacter myungsuensis]
MKKYSLLVMLAAGMLFASCSSKNDNPNPDPGTNPPTNNTNVVEVSGDISANTTWSASKIYLLKGFVYVTNGATLTIEAGTIIKGDKATKGTLIVTRGSQVNATGTADKPIVFTSNVAAGGRSAGDWGGVILLGRAPVNPAGGFATIEGGLIPTNGGANDKYIQYGGNVAADNSGTLKYVRIEYAGIPFSPDSEINGLTLGGVGSATTIDYVEVYRSGDDAFEWFGGTVNAKHLLAIGSVDDDFDTDFGFSGKVQFGLAQRAQVIADVSGSNGFESDNDATGTNNTPQTSAVFANMTIVGPAFNGTTLAAIAAGGSQSGINANFQHAAQIRRNSAISISNSVFTNYTEGVYFDDGTVVTAGATSDNYVNSRSVVKNNIIFGSNSKSNQLKGTAGVLAKIFAGIASIQAQLTADNTIDAAKTGTDLYVAPFKYGSDFKASGNALFGTPNFILAANSVAAAGATWTGKYADAFFEQVAFRGAFGTTDWSSGWASYDPQNIAYTTPGVVR